MATLPTAPAVATASCQLSAPRCVWDARATLGEGTCWSVREQALYWVDLLGQRLYRYHPETDARSLWEFDDVVTAVAECATPSTRQRLAVTLRRGLAIFEPGDGTLEPLCQPELECAERTNNRFNDGKCDRQGRFWGGTMDFNATAPTGALYRFDAGKPAVCVADLGWPVTNGPTWSLDGKTMYLNNTVHRQVYAFDFDAASGTAGNQRLWLTLAPADGHPDGMTTDAAGRIWIAHWGGACISCHDPETGGELARATLPASHITNVAFGGPELKTLFVTSARAGLSDAQLAAEPLAGALFAFDTNAQGLPAHLFAG